MKKTDAHFKIASWTIKHPKSTYGVIAGAAMGLLLAGVGLTVGLTGLKSGSSNSVMSTPVNVVDAGPEFQRAGWNIRSQTEQDGLRCIAYTKQSNNTRLTSCYRQVNGVWEHRSSF